MEFKIRLVLELLKEKKTLVEIAIRNKIVPSSFKIIILDVKVSYNNMLRRTMILENIIE